MTNYFAAVTVAAEWTLGGPARVRYRLDQSPAAKIKNVGARQQLVDYNNNCFITNKPSQARSDQAKAIRNNIYLL